MHKTFELRALNNRFDQNQRVSKYRGLLQSLLERTSVSDRFPRSNMKKLHVICTTVNSLSDDDSQLDKGKVIEFKSALYNATTKADDLLIGILFAPMLSAGYVIMFFLSYAVLTIRYWNCNKRDILIHLSGLHTMRAIWPVFVTVL